MPPFETLIAFAMATAVFAYMPGPAMLYATAQTLAHGRQGGLMAALGIHVGGYVHVLAAAFGLAILFELVPALYVALKFIGAAYLIWLGTRMILARNHPLAGQGPEQDRAQDQAQGGSGPSPTFRHSIAVEVLNPKTALFFVAFLPQFSDPSAALPIWAQLLILGTVVNLMFSSADMLCVALAHRVRQRLAGSVRAQARAGVLGGSVLIGLGAAIALDR